jgi:uncharacterized damage-inducible protein DinB
MSTILSELFRHNLWANLTLLDACAPLTDAQLDATVPGTYSTIRDTLKHLAGAEHRYVALLTDSKPTRSIEREEWPGIDGLREALTQTGQALTEIAEREQPGRILRGMRGDEPYEMPAWLPLTQAINHATDHRSHVCTILTQQGIEPPGIDAWHYHFPPS